MRASPVVLGLPRRAKPQEEKRGQKQKKIQKCWLDYKNHTFYNNMKCIYLRKKTEYW